MKKYTIGIIAVVIALIAIGINQFKSTGVGADAVTPIAGQTYTLAGSGVSSSDDSITLTSLTITQTGYKILDADMSETFYLTLEPGSRSRQEIVSCTTVTQNSGNTATLSGCVRGLQPFSPYTSSIDYSFAHSGGSTVIFSNPPQLYNQAAFKDNDETITGAWLFPTPLSNDSAATKSYVDSVVTGTTTLSNDRFIIAGTAGETLATGTLVYFKGSDQEWYKVDTDDTTTFQDKFIGLTQGGGVNAGAINRGILLKGRDVTQTGMTAGATYYASTSAGIISTATSAQPIGVADDTNVLYFDPVLIDIPRLGYNNTWTGTNTFLGTVNFTGTTTVRVYTTATSTWTKPTGVREVMVTVCGAGGSGSAASGGSGGGGAGGGGCSFELLDANELISTSSVVVTVGLVGSATSSFGGFLSATGGKAGSSASDGGVGGKGSGGDLNISGQAGSFSYLTVSSAYGGTGGSSYLGGGGLGGSASGIAGQAGGNYGGGGGGGWGCGSSGCGGTFTSGGAGAQGVVIITEYY